MTQEMVTISREWAKACGIPDDDRTFRVLRIDEKASYSAMGTCIIVERDGREWTVFQTRLEQK